MLAIGDFPEFGSGRFVFDYAGMRVAPLTPASPGRWNLSGSLDGRAAPFQSIRLDNRTLHVGSRRLSPIKIRREPFEVERGGIKLSAEIASPMGRRPRGAVLMIYGSGPAPKEAFDLWSFWFLAQGYRVVTYDKRGSGSSGGDWRLTSLEDLAADARSVLERARKLGLNGPVYAWGASQAGWIEPQLGAAGLVDGIIMHAGAAVRPRQQILSSVAAELRAYGFSEAEILKATAYYSLDTDVSKGVRPWADINAAYVKRPPIKLSGCWLLLLHPRLRNAR